MVVGCLEQPKERAQESQRENENRGVCGKAKVRAMQVSALDRPDFSKRKILGGDQEGMQFVSFSKGSTSPLVSQVTEDVLDSRFLNQSKNHCHSSSRCAFSFSPFPWGG